MWVRLNSYSSLFQFMDFERCYMAFYISNNDPKI